jgi:dTDP-4-amino-4,6-dideoxygalactose transaminase
VIPHSRPSLTAEDAERVAGVVLGGHIAQGPQVAAFERALALRLGVEAVAAVASGSAALELALRALGVSVGDEVIVPSYACDALYHAATRCGAVPVLADADPGTRSLCPKDALARRTRRTRCAIVPHAFGLAVDLDAFAALEVPLVEDCAQALGATVNGRPAGSRGTLAVCSFYATKIVTTGEGGAVAGPETLVRRVRDARDYDGRADLTPRTNAKLTDMQAALGLGQLERLEAFVGRRRAIAGRYRERLRGVACRLPQDEGERHVYHRFVVALDRSLAEVARALAERGVEARRPVFRPAHHALGLPGFPEADRLWEESLSIPCYPGLDDAEVERVASALAEALAP